MSAFLAVISTEYRMAIRRWGVWLAFFLGALPTIAVVLPLRGSLAGLPLRDLGGTAASGMNFFLPVIAGIAIADRLPRDVRLGVMELLQSTPLTRRQYILGKYTGAVLAALTPIFIIDVVHIVLLITVNGVSAAVVVPALLAFLGINVPAIAFIAAYSLACPVVLPVRAYQVLFTGYWFWGNYMNPRMMPTLSETLLDASGQYVANAFFRTARDRPMILPLGLSANAAAAGNILLLAACTVLALVVLDRVLAWKESAA